MLQSRTLRRIVFATLVAVALTLVPAMPAAASSAQGWSLATIPAAWDLLWDTIAQLWVGREETGSAPLEIGAYIDPHG